jgi:hypothetical protein
VLWGIADYWLNARALRQRLVAMGGGPDDAPLHVVKQYVREGLTASAVTLNMPKPDRVEFYFAPVAGADSVLVTHYVYRLATRDWPVDIYYGSGGSVADLWAADNPSLASARRLSEAEARRRLAL